MIYIKYDLRRISVCHNAPVIIYDNLNSPKVLYVCEICGDECEIKYKKFWFLMFEKPRFLKKLSRRYGLWWERVLMIFLFILIIGYFYLAMLGLISLFGIKPCRKPDILPKSINTGKTLKNVRKVVKTDKFDGSTPILSGQASYYSREGCLGCSPTLTMANGEILDDLKYTVALPEKYFNIFINKFVKVVNPITKLSVMAKVTDTGGFDKLNRVADLSLATKNAIGCGGLCQVEIYYDN